MRSIHSLPLVLTGLTLFSACSVQVTHEVSRTTQVQYDPEIAKALMKVGQLNPAQGGLAPAISDRTTYSFADGTATRILIQSPESKFKALTSTDGQVHISATVSAATAEEVEAFKKAARTSVDGGDVTIKIVGGSTYFCNQSTLVLNGTVKRWVKGTCVSDFEIAVPRGGRTQVYYNGAPAFPMEEAGIAMLPAILTAQNSDSDRESVLEKFLSLHRERFPAQDVARVIRTFSSPFSMKDAVVRFSGLVANPGNLADILSPISSPFSQVDAARAIIEGVRRGERFITMNQVIAAIQLVTSPFSQKDICELLRGRVVDPQNAAQVLDKISSSFAAQDAERALAE